MLTIRIHLYYISVAFTYRIFIAKLQPTSISQIKHMSNYIMLSFLSYMIRCILRCIIHNQYVCNLRYLRLFQFFQKRNDCFFLIVCRNNDQDFFFCFFSNVFSVLHRYYSLFLCYLKQFQDILLFRGHPGYCPLSVLPAFLLIPQKFSYISAYFL